MAGWFIDAPDPIDAFFHLRAPTSVLEEARALWQGLSPSQLFVGSFALLILAVIMALIVLAGFWTADRLVNSLFMSVTA